MHYLLLLALIACTRTDYQAFRECKQQHFLLALVLAFLGATHPRVGNCTYAIDEGG